MDTASRVNRGVAFLAHYGVKGMKWGVRKDEGHEGERVKVKKLGKLDDKWEKEQESMRTYAKVHNKVADRMNNGEIDKFNSDPRWTKAADDGVLNDFDHPETKAYYDAYESLTNRVFAEEYSKLGSNPSGSKRWVLRSDEDGNPYAEIAPADEEARHAVVDVVFKINRGANGLIESLSEPVIKHYGVKGMKWGVRRSRAELAADSADTARKKELQTQIKTNRKSTDSLSNDDLQALVNRMRLEQQYTQLSQPKQNAGVKFVQQLLGNTAKQQSQVVLNDYATQMRKDLMDKK